MSAGALRIAFAGVAHSHPFADAAHLRARGAALVSVWDPDDPGPAARFAERFAVPSRESLADLLADAPDAVVVTVRTPRAAEVARACAGVPAFFNKTIAADEDGLNAWLAAARDRHFTTSVLRFAPALERCADILVTERVRALDVVAQHDISAFLLPDRRWQDDPAGAGGTLLNIGVHAWEMLDVVLPGARLDVLSARASRGRARTMSELVATVHGTMDDVPVTVTVSGVPEADRYSLRAVTDRGIREIVLGDGAEALGYLGTADAVLRLAREGRPPVPGKRTRAVYANALAAARAARG